MTLSSQQTSRLLSYPLAILLSGVAFVLSHLMTPRIENAPFALFQGAVVICAVYGGLGPALLTTFLSILALDYFFLPPYNAFSLAVADVLQLMTFGAVALLTSSISARLKRANAKVRQENHQRLEAEKEILQISSREQRRLGEDLHDGLCQTLAGLRLISQELKNRLRREGAAAWSEVDLIEARLAEALTQADLASRGLYPVELEAEGLRTALQELTQKTSALYRVDCRFRCPNDVLVHDSATANHLYRIAQEAIINAIKRGRSKHISVFLHEYRGEILLSVTDDGIGLGREKPRKGMGLKIMAYRARLINAALDIRSRARRCTRVTCRFVDEKERVLAHGV